MRRRRIDPKPPFSQSAPAGKRAQSASVRFSGAIRWGISTTPIRANWHCLKYPPFRCYAGACQPTDRRRSPDNRTSRGAPLSQVGCFALAFARHRRPAFRLPDQCRRAANRFPARSDRPAAGGVRRPRIRATTVIARARSSTSMTPLYHKRQCRQTRTEKSAREERSRARPPLRPSPHVAQPGRRLTAPSSHARRRPIVRRASRRGGGRLVPHTPALRLPIPAALPAVETLCRGAAHPSGPALHGSFLARCGPLFHPAGPAAAARPAGADSGHRPSPPAQPGNQALRRPGKSSRPLLRRPPASPEPTQPDRRADEGETPSSTPHQAPATRRCRAVPGR